MSDVVLYDTTLRDGSQMEGIALTVDDKLRITEKLDELGINVIEGGMPGANPKDYEYFQHVHKLSLQHALIAAFGATRRAGITADKDPNLQALLESEARMCTLVSKSDIRHVTQVLETTAVENLRMIEESISFLKQRGRRVVMDAEHFFDGYKHDPVYALKTLEVALAAGAESLDLCDTNGGTLPYELTGIIDVVKKSFPSARLGIHVHNDCDMAVANSIAAYEHGVREIQGTMNGWGERTGNANLCSIIPVLAVKKNLPVVTKEQLGKITEVSHYMDGIANLAPRPTQPFVGLSAFAHKAGLHAAAIAKWEMSYQHMDPERVGNRKRVLVSELSGRGNIVTKAKEVGIDLSNDKDRVEKVLRKVKEQENKGFQYEGADASFELLVHKAVGDYKPVFELVDYMVVMDRRQVSVDGLAGQHVRAQAMVKVRVGENVYHNAGDGDGPVNALDGAFRKALREHYAAVDSVKLIDYKVRILEEAAGTAARVRVLIESTDGKSEWRTVGSSTDIIEASWMALSDSLEYFLLKQGAGIQHPVQA